MIYLVSKQSQLFETDIYEKISLEKAKEMISSKDFIEFDSETEGLDPHTKKLLCIQFGLGEDQIVVDTTTISVLEFKDIFEDPKKTFLGWNIAFDLMFLYINNIFPENVIDGMVIERLLYIGYPSGFHSLSLHAAADQYLHIDLDKSVRGDIITKGLTVSVINYAAHDVTYLTAIYKEQMKDVKYKELENAVKFECAFTPVLAYIKLCGAKIDVNKWRQKIDNDAVLSKESEDKINKQVLDYYEANKYESDNIESYYIRKQLVTTPRKEGKDILKYFNESCKVLERKQQDNGNIIYDYIVKFPFIYKDMQGDLFNGYDTAFKCNIKWKSSQQVIKLFEIIGINCSSFDKETKEKKKSCDIKVIKPQENKFPIIKAYIEYKKTQMLLNTFGEKFLKLLNPKTHRIHADFYQMGTDTCRLSSNSPNLQNLPHDAFTRSCFVADKGNKWISADYSGQESFLMASIANDTAMLDELINGSKDMHSLVAKIVFKDKIPADMPTSDVKKNFHELRQEAKGYESTQKMCLLLNINILDLAN